MDARTDAIADLLPWDTEHFGVRIARARGARLTADAVAALDAWCAVNRVDCLYCFADPTDAETARQAGRGAFQLVDLRTTMARELTQADRSRETSEERFRRAEQGDAGWLVSLSRQSYRGSRFYFDGRFGADRCDLLYEIWILKCLRDPAQVVWLAHDQGRALGYIACQCDAPAQVGSIALVAVDPASRGAGVGRGLVEQAVTHFAGLGMARVRVVTQARNVSALRAYERSGFLMDELRLTYHKWYSPPGRSP